MLQRLKRLIALSKKDPQAIEDLLESDIDLLPDGNGKAEFLGTGSEEEFREQERKDKGFAGIFGIGKH